MDLGPYQLPTRVVGFTFSQGERTLDVEASTAKLQTQRSLLSELLAAQVFAGEEEEESSVTFDGDDSSGDDDDSPATITRQGTYEQLLRGPSDPIAIPCSGSLANQRVKDALRRQLYQRQIEQLYQQQQQRLAVQQRQQALLQQQVYQQQVHQQQMYQQQVYQQQVVQQQATHDPQGGQFRAAAGGARLRTGGVRAF